MLGQLDACFRSQTDLMLILHRFICHKDTGCIHNSLVSKFSPIHAKTTQNKLQAPNSFIYPFFGDTHSSYCIYSLSAASQVLYIIALFSYTKVMKPIFHTQMPNRILNKTHHSHGNFIKQIKMYEFEDIKLTANLLIEKLIFRNTNCKLFLHM